MNTAPDTPSDEPAEPTKPSRPISHSILLLAGSLGPLGHAPASGTVAVAVAGVPLAWWMVGNLSPTVYAVVCVVFALVSMLLHHLGDKILGESDSRKLVWDELAGFFFAMFLVPRTAPLFVIGFFVERIIDIVKVPPANIIDRKWHNGAGVVLDDVVAGIYTCILLHVLSRLIPSLAS